MSRLDSLGNGYALEDLLAVLAGQKEHTPRQKPVKQADPPKVNLLVDIQAKLQAGKGAGYVRWAKVFNLKQMAQTVNYLTEHNLLEYAVLEEKAAAATAHHNELSAKIKAAEKRMAEIAVLRTHIINYAKTRDTYLSPSHYKRTLGEITHENLVGNGHWQTRTVAKILRAEVYTGDLVQGVSKIIDHKQVRASADEWTTVRGTHEAIISRELFAAVQKALDQAAQQAKDREIHSWSPNLLRGKIFCAHCGRSLHRQKCVRRKSQEVYVYHCISNNRIKKGVCPGAFILEKELLDALADMIQEQLDTTLGQYSLGLENLTKEAEEQKNIQAKIASRKQEIQQLRTYQRGLYEGLIQNHLSKDEYFTFKEKYEAKIEAISREIEQLKAGLAIIAKQLEQYKMLSQDAQHIKEDRQLTAALIDRLIDRVEVSREKRITVRFRFQNEFEHCEEVLSQCRNM